MINLTKYILEKLHIDKTVNVDNKTVVEKIYNILIQDKYKVTFKLKKDSNLEDFIYKIPDQKLKYYIKEIKECFKLTNTNGYDIYKMSVWENGSLYFYENPKYSQGKIVHHANNTDFVYFILVKGNECTLCGYNRRYMGLPNEVGTQYKFKI